MIQQIKSILYDGLVSTEFHLARTDITWSSGMSTTGWGRSDSLDVAHRKSISECVERFAYQHLPAVTWASGQEIIDYIHPERLLRYSPCQYAAADFPFSPFDSQLKRWWAKAYDYQNCDSKWILADHVYGPRAFDKDYRKSLVTYATTSGCASATNRDEARCNALFELIERDAFMRHWFAQRPGCSILPASLPTTLSARIRRLESAGCRVGLQVLNMGIHPVWLVWAQNQQRHFTCVGTATGICAERALISALEELETTAWARIEGVNAHPLAPESVRRPEDHGAIYATTAYYQKADRLLNFSAYPSHTFDDCSRHFGLQMESIVQAMMLAGKKPYWVDMTIDNLVINGLTFHTARAVATDMIPACFGHNRMPMGMNVWNEQNLPQIHPLA